jgi:hypothetical protein
MHSAERRAVPSALCADLSARGDSDLVFVLLSTRLSHQPTSPRAFHLQFLPDVLSL